MSTYSSIRIAVQNVQPLSVQMDPSHLQSYSSVHIIVCTGARAHMCLFRYMPIRISTHRKQGRWRGTCGRLSFGSGRTFRHVHVYACACTPMHMPVHLPVQMSMRVPIPMSVYKSTIHAHSYTFPQCLACPYTCPYPFIIHKYVHLIHLSIPRDHGRWCSVCTARTSCMPACMYSLWTMFGAHAHIHAHIHTNVHMHEHTHTHLHSYTMSMNMSIRMSVLMCITHCYKDA